MQTPDLLVRPDIQNFEGHVQGINTLPAWKTLAHHQFWILGHAHVIPASEVRALSLESINALIASLSDQLSKSKQSYLLNFNFKIFGKWENQSGQEMVRLLKFCQDIFPISSIFFLSL